MAREGVQFKTDTATITTSFTTIPDAVYGALGCITRGRAVDMCFEVVNAGATTFSDFKLQVKDHENGEFYDFLSGVDWQASNIANLLFSSYNATGPVPGPNTTATGARSHAHVRLNGCWAFRFQAKVGASTSAGVYVRGIYGKE